MRCRVTMLHGTPRRNDGDPFTTLLTNLQRRLPDRRHVYHIYAVRVPGRDAVQQALLRQGIQTGIHYPIPVHLQPAHADLGYRTGAFPCAERAAREASLGDRIGDRMLSRLAEMCITVKMTGKDFRQTVKRARFG